MEQLEQEFRKKKKLYHLGFLLDLLSVVAIVGGFMSTVQTGKATGILLGALFAAIAIIFFCSASSNYAKIEQKAMKEIWERSHSTEEAREKMIALGCRDNYIEGFIKNQERLSTMRKKEAARKKEYEEVCKRCEEVLKTKPEHCNTVTITDSTPLLKQFESYQYHLKWSTWKHDETLHFYVPRLTNYYSAPFKEAPYAFSINIDDIQYFRQEGEKTSEIKISGGKIKQDKKTGKISQTPIKSQTVEHDERRTVLTITKDSVVMKINFTHGAYDVFFALIPEKEFTRVRKG